MFNIKADSSLTQTLSTAEGCKRRVLSDIASAGAVDHALFDV